MPERFKNDMAYPPGGVYFCGMDTVTGPIRFEAASLASLETLVHRFCDSNSLPRPGNFEAWVQGQMCDHMPPGFCTGPAVHRPLSVSLQQVKDFTRVLVRRALSGTGRFFVSRMEADRRAAVCSNCPLNSNTQCTICFGLLALVRSLVGRRETKYDVGLGTCAICKCLLRVKVHVSREALARATSAPEPGSLPAGCWLRGVYWPDPLKAEGVST